MNTTAEHIARKRIAVATMGVKLGDETRGYTRFRFLSELLVREGFEVDLITSSFQHWEKAQRDCSKACYQGLPYRVVFIEEPGYTKNLDLARILSHRTAAKNLRAHFERAFANPATAYDLVYAEIPPNDVARVCAEEARAHGVPFVADVNDLWPEAMRMVVNIPIASDIAFYPFARDAKRVYQLASGIVGTSDEYAARPAQDRSEPYPRKTVYVGNNLSAFDDGAAAHAASIDKPADELWAVYAGTLGASYDLSTLVRAAALLEQRRSPAAPAADIAPGAAAGESTASAATAPAHPRLRVKILGDGPDRAALEELAQRENAPVDFLGYTDYPLMAAYLCASDITINSLVSSAAQSIVTKIGDYLASGNPLVNTGTSPEFRAKVESDGFGVNVEAENPDALADALCALCADEEVRARMGAKARTIAEREFDQAHSYLAIVDLIRSLLA